MVNGQVKDNVPLFLKIVVVVGGGGREGDGREGEGERGGEVIV